MKNAPPNRPTSRPLLRRAEQTVVAALVCVSLSAMGAWWLARGGQGGRLIELDRVAPRSVKFLVDVNRADWPELAQLPEVGEVLAKRIVQSRQSAGPFVDLEQLLRVHGIGPRTLDRIRPYLAPLPASGTVVNRK